MPESDKPSPGAPSAKVMSWAVAGAALLAVGGAVTFYWATQKIQVPTDGEEAVVVTVTSTACEPNDLAVAAGRRRFVIANASDRPVEWEILDGVMVVAERENIAPGFHQGMTVDLAPGDYAITCGLLSNPRGALHVTPSQEYADATSSVSLRNFLGPLSEYKVYLALQSRAAVDAAQALADAIRAGDLEQARALYGPARQPYKRLEPIAYRLSDLENAIDPVADYLEKREADPAFTGFHRIEYGLFAEGRLDGLAPVADTLVADITRLKERLGSLTLTPALLIGAPGDMAGQLASGRIAAGEEHYAHDDLADFAANLEGIGKLAGLLRQVVAPVDLALAAEMDARLEVTRRTLAGLAQEDGSFPSYETIGEEQRAALSRSFAVLAETYGKLEPTIGVM